MNKETDNIHRGNGLAHRFIMTIVIGLTLSIGTYAARLTTFRVNRMAQATGVMRTAQFGWQIESGKRDVKQTAYRIVVATSQRALTQETGGRELLWDSEQVESEETLQVPYQGRRLPCQSDIYWQVTVWLSTGERIKSPVQKFNTGMQLADWHAQWIGINDPENVITEETGCRTLPARYLRREFQIKGKVRRAVLYVSGMGASNTYINGQHVCKDIMGTLPTGYDRTLYYNTYEVTQLLHKGTNAIAAVLGNGYALGLRTEHRSFGLPRLKAQLRVETDTDTLVIPTSDEWRATADGPITAKIGRASCRERV